MTSRDIREKQFETAKRRGYVKEDVDGYLDKVIAAFEALERGVSDLQTENANLRVRIHDEEMEIRELRCALPETDKRERELREQVEALQNRAQELEQENEQLKSRESEEQNTPPGTQETGRQALCSEIQVHQKALEHLEEAKQQAEQQAASADEYAASAMREGSTCINEARSVITGTLDQLEVFRQELGRLIVDEGGQLIAGIDALCGMQGVLEALDKGSTMLLERADGYQDRDHSSLTGGKKTAGSKKTVRERRVTPTVSGRVPSAGSKTKRSPKKSDASPARESSSKSTDEVRINQTDPADLPA